MITHSFLQGSPEWHAYRANHFNASDAPAMMGESAYQKRTELLHSMKTGAVKDVDEATQRRFDEGHRMEALARPLAEEIIGEELFPVVGSLGELSMSSDGLTMDGAINFEHKTLNDELRGAIGKTLPAQYRIQMEQQMLVSGATKTLFMASKWSGDELVEEKHCWYKSDPDLRKSIVDGWSQFAKDLAAYVPSQAESKPEAAAIERLPALNIQIRGEVTLSNLPEFKVAAERFIAGIKTSLQTDSDFSDAEHTVKFLEKAEKDLEAAKAAAIGQTATIDELMRTVDYIKDKLRVKRLDLSKSVDKRKAEIKDAVLASAKRALEQHIGAINAELGSVYLVAPPADFGGAAKNKRTLNSLEDAVQTELAKAKIAADGIGREIRAKLAWFKTASIGHGILFEDLQSLIYKPAEDFELAVTKRITDAKELQEAKAAFEKSDAQAKQAAIELLEIIEANPISAPVLKHGALPVTQAQFEKTYPANTTRTEINELLDQLNQSDLSRVLSFVKSRFLQAA